MTNRLVRETSPYLRQHANNPVDWYPWGDEALMRARIEDKPILLSVGYSACHWCHVMAHESFENGNIARLMNENFVNIKVDREERPDIDSIYMEAIQAISGRGGWPMTVFLTPDTKPFFGGTYFPPEDRQGMPGFPRVLQAVIDAYQNRRSEITQAVKQITAALAISDSDQEKVTLLSVDILNQAYSNLRQSFDWDNGGFGGAPKFPHPMVLEFMLRYYYRTHEAQALEMVMITLEKMAAGGIYDQLGGGFHRYATDNVWTVPHFEKMLYDNALLSRVYLQAFQVTGKREFRRIAEETLDYVLRDMTGARGGFFSTLDADSEGGEGKYYVWAPEEIRQILGDKTGGMVNSYYGVTPGGNFEGQNILRVPGGLSADLPDWLKESRSALLSSRMRRIRPDRDEKIITSWNGLMLASLADAACILDREDYLKAAVTNGRFLLDAITDGRYLKHTWKDGQSKVEGFLEDYALVADAFISLHQATFSGEWLRHAIRMAEVIVQEFWDESTNTFYDTSERHPALFTRPKNFFDNAVPSGASAATLVLLKIARITGRAEMEKIAVSALRAMATMNSHPLGFGRWLCALDFYLSPSQEVVIVGHRNDENTRKLLRVLYGTWLPNHIVVANDPADQDSLKGLPIFEGKLMVDGLTSAYVCERFVCHTPATTPDALRKLLPGA